MDYGKKTLPVIAAHPTRIGTLTTVQCVGMSNWVVRYHTSTLDTATARKSMKNDGALPVNEGESGLAGGNLNK